LIRFSRKSGFNPKTNIDPFPGNFAYIQPDIQFVSRPGGTGTIDDAVVIGAQMGVSF
jgi:carbohydrate-selective porin OprB